MAKYRSRCALNSAMIPLTAQLAGRTVMTPQYDTSLRQPQDSYGTGESRELSDPQLIYIENVMPTVEGIVSVNYEEIIAGIPGASDFDQAITLRDADENTYLYVPAAGKNYIYDPTTGNWIIAPFNPAPTVTWTGKLITRAYVNGRTFICFESQGIYEYNPTTKQFDKQTLLGLTDAQVRGIGASSNYLIAFTELEVHWSSLIDPTDFVPSLSTGAGYAIPQDVKARITACLGISGGFVIYTARNAIAAVYTNNVRAPFTFKEISNAGGIQTYEQVTSEQTSGAQYAWTTGGFQKVTVQSAEPVSGAVNDFIAGRMWDQFDIATGKLELFYSSAAEFPVKLSFISSRYVVMSYSTSADTTAYEWCIVLDTILKRWGKLKVTHVDCFSYPYPNVSGVIRYIDLQATTYNDLTQTRYLDLNTGVVSDPPSKRTIAFLQQDGTVKLAIFDYNKDVISEGVLMFGKIQLTRAKMLQLQSLDLEGVYQEEEDDVIPAPGAGMFPYTVRVSNSVNGYKTTRILDAIRILAESKMARWAKRLEGTNVDVRVVGTFALSSLLVEVTAEGDR